LVLLLALAQVLLPRLAASKISSKVSRYGKVQSVSVSAWPAIELLWGDAGSVHVRARSMSLNPEQASSLLWEARNSSNVVVEAQSVHVGSLRLSDVRLSKHGAALSARALASEEAVREALPAGFGVKLVRSEGGEVEVQATGGFFGLSATVNAVASAVEGKLVAHPVGFLIEALQLTLFSSPHVYVEGVGASVHSEQPLTYQLSMNASLR
jgi:hypothetical protein